ncbi:MAG TPA: ribosome small subunit-dependent GTPase A [Steroidobacteraceae bacterium]|nr:ribosome small subunit-dependent GTPase A [Steroidobacteraceae bacterium]
MPEPSSSPRFAARVSAVFGRDLLVREPDGTEHRARVRGRRLNVVCGDDVVCERDPTHGEVNVVEVRRRRTALYRSNLRGEAEPVVANVSRLFVVLAPKPVPDFFVVDRYLAAATSAAIEATLVLNKRDLPVDPDLHAELSAYLAAGYSTIACSAREGDGIDELLGAAVGAVAALVGQSGVGKSSLIRRLIPEAQVQIGELMREEEGRHTTTTSRMFELPRGGYLIDSPGVRDFAPAIDRLDPRTMGFTEVARLAPGCRFQDCQHLREPNCAVRAAAESGALHERRYESYRRLRRLYDDLVKARGPKYRPGQPTN